MPERDSSSARAAAGDGTLLEGRFLRFEQRRGWEFVSRTNCSGVIAVVAVTSGGALLLVEQYRPPLDASVIELPAGLVDDEGLCGGESEEEAVRRELLEETGYRAGRVRRLAGGPPSAGLSSESIALYRADDLVRESGGGGIDNENIRVHEVPLPEVRQWLAARQVDGCLVALTVYAGLFFLPRDLAP